jgi:radical SAM protein with 4Fe4S-binding SPASM domain
MCLVTYSWKEPTSMKKIENFQSKKHVTWAHIEITDACNFNCEWCYAGITSRKKYEHLSTERWNRMIKILSESGIKQITFSGGEPLMHPDIVKFVEDATCNGMVAHINTNGFFLTKDLAQKLKKAGLAQVQINIDVLDPELHDKIRGREGSFQRAMDALKNASEAGIDRVSQTVLTKINEDKITEIIKFAREKLNIERCRVWDMTPSGTAIDKTNLRSERYSEKLEKITEFAAGIGAKHVISYEPLFPIKYESPIPITHIPCPSSSGILVHIFRDGTVFFCSTLRDYKLYNVFDYNSISDVHGEKIEDFRREFNYDKGCDSCDYREKCNRGCPSRIAKTNYAKDYQCII